MLEGARRPGCSRPAAGVGRVGRRPPAQPLDTLGHRRRQGGLLVSDGDAAEGDHPGKKGRNLTSRAHQFGIFLVNRYIKLGGFGGEKLFALRLEGQGALRFLLLHGTFNFVHSALKAQE